MARTRKKELEQALAPVETVVAAVLRAPDGYERYQPALDALMNGATRQQAAAGMGISKQALDQAICTMPEVAQGLSQRRAALREVANLQALALLSGRLETNPDKISNRDLTDILRAIKPPHEDLAGNIQVRINLPMPR